MLNRAGTSSAMGHEKPDGVAVDPQGYKAREPRAEPPALPVLLLMISLQSCEVDVSSSWVRKLKFGV